LANDSAIAASRKCGGKCAMERATLRASVERANAAYRTAAAIATSTAPRERRLCDARAASVKRGGSAADMGRRS
jgi:hypothetical protein